MEKEQIQMKNFDSQMAQKGKKVYTWIIINKYSIFTFHFAISLKIIEIGYIASKPVKGRDNCFKIIQERRKLKRNIVNKGINRKYILIILNKSKQMNNHNEIKRLNT